MSIWRLLRRYLTCSQNKRRSLTAERIFNGVNGHSAYSAGTENHARVKVTAGMLSRADIIFCMEKKHIRRINDKYGDVICGKKVICLHIPDVSGYMDEELIAVLESCVMEYIS